MRFSTLFTGGFALLCAGYFAYQAQQATALTAVKPVVEKAAEDTKKTAADTQKYGTFTCTPEGFTLTSTADGYHLKGVIETPTAGFNYTPEYIDETADAADMKFVLRGPQGMVAQVIGKMEIDHMYVRDGAMQTMTVRLDKTFNWGPDTIVCQNTSAPKSEAQPEQQQETPDASDTDAPVAE